MKNISLYLLLLIGGLVTPLSEIKASMNRMIFKKGNKTTNIHIFCNDGKRSNLFKLVNIPTYGEQVMVGYRLNPNKYYKSLKEFSKQPEYLYNDWSIDNELSKRLLPIYEVCIIRKMSDTTAIDFIQNYMNYCVYPKRPKKYCFKD